MHQIGSRKRNQPAPPHIVFESLTQPARPTVRPWLMLLNDEQLPTVGDVHAPHLVHWTSLWPTRPDVLICFDLPSDGGYGTDLRWTLFAADPLPDSSTIRHFRRGLQHRGTRHDHATVL